MALAVEDPIVNDPFSEPSCYWEYKEGQPQLITGRRPAGYYLLARTRTGAGPLTAEEFVPLDLVKTIRERVKKWRENNYKGIAPVTRMLLSYWTKVARERRLFFCQQEAAETFIWLAEAPPAEKQGIVIPPDVPDDPESLRMGGTGRFCAMPVNGRWAIRNQN